jgi:hypothetical protein
MLRGRFLSRPQWEKKLKGIGAEPLEGLTPLNSSVWWRVPGRSPFTVPVELDGRAEFWAIQKIITQQTGR